MCTNKNALTLTHVHKCTHMHTTANTNKVLRAQPHMCIHTRAHAFTVTRVCMLNRTRFHRGLLQSDRRVGVAHHRVRSLWCISKHSAEVNPTPPLCPSPGLSPRARAASGAPPVLRGGHERAERLGEHGPARLRPLQPGGSRPLLSSNSHWLLQSELNSHWLLQSELKGGNALIDASH